MRKIRVNKAVIELYDSIDEMPIANFQKYNKYLLIDSGIGSDIDDFDRHLAKIIAFLKANPKKAMQELQNLRQNVAMINNELSPKYLAFAAIIKSIDGKEQTDLSDENLKAILTSINTIKHSTLTGILEEIKKKVSTELELYFPSDFADSKKKELYDRFKQRALYELDGIINGNNNSQQIAQIDAYLLNLHKPQSFMGSGSAEILYDKQFETACLLIAQKSSLNPKSLTVLQFYNALENIRKQQEQIAKLNKAKRH